MNDTVGASGVKGTSGIARDVDPPSGATWLRTQWQRNQVIGQTHLFVVAGVYTTLPSDCPMTFQANLSRSSPLESNVSFLPCPPFESYSDLNLFLSFTSLMRLHEHNSKICSFTPLNSLSTLLRTTFTFFLPSSLFAKCILCPESYYTVNSLKVLYHVP